MHLESDFLIRRSQINRQTARYEARIQALRCQLPALKGLIRLKMHTASKNRQYSQLLAHKFLGRAEELYKIILRIYNVIVN